MSNHTGTVRACQYPPSPHAIETTLLPPPSDAIDRRLVVRYGAQLLTGGYTAIPTYAWVYYARLGVSEAEMVCVAQLCTYWWSTRDPFPGEAVIAERMGKTVRCIQNYLRSLEAKGLLRIQAQFSVHGRQQSNTYDLRPFFAAVEGRARLDGLLAAPADVPPAPATPVPDTDRDRPAQLPRAGGNGGNEAGLGGPGHERAQPHPCAEQDPLCVGATGGRPDIRLRDTDPRVTEEGEGLYRGRAKNPSPQVDPIETDLFDLDSIPLTPAETARTTRSDDRRATADGGPDDQALAHRIADLSSEFGDDAPTSSLTRARSLGQTAGVPPKGFLQLLDEAAARTRARQAHIIKRQRDGLAVNGMPYFFAVLADLLHPAPPRTRTAPDRRRPGRRRPPKASGEAVDYVAWTGAAAAPDASDPAASSPEQNPTWRCALDELSNDMLRENYARWFEPTRVIGDDGATLRIAVPDAFHQQWLDRRLRPVVERVMARIAAGVRVAFVVDPAACAPHKAASRAS